MRSVYGKIVTFPKKERAYLRWLDNETFEEIARTAGVQAATVQIYVIDKIASGVKRTDLHERLIRELKIRDEFEVVYDLLCGRSITLREIRDSTQLTYNQIRAVIALLISSYEL